MKLGLHAGYWGLGVFPEELLVSPVAANQAERVQMLRDLAEVAA